MVGVMVGFVVDSWLVHGWFMVGLWLVYGWFHGWFVVGSRLVRILIFGVHATARISSGMYFGIMAVGTQKQPTLMFETGRTQNVCTNTKLIYENRLFY